MSNTEIILLASAMFLMGMWLGIFICICIDNRHKDERLSNDIDQEIWERIEGWRK